MNVNDPIRMADVRKARTVAASMSRVEVERQFKMSLMLVIVLTVATLAITAVNHISTTDTVHLPVTTQVSQG